MIPILIGNKKYSIKAIDELTTSEFIELTDKKITSVLSYIAWQCKIPENDAFMCRYHKSLDDMIGKLPDITKMKKSKRFDYTKTISTVGQRHQVEESKKKGYELLVYCLAVSQVNSPDYSKVQARYDYYMKQPFTEILPAGFFFIRTYQNGNRCVQVYLRKLRELIKILQIRKTLVLTSFLPLLLSMKLKRCVAFLMHLMKKS